MSNSYSPPENILAKNMTVAFSLANFYGEGPMDEPRFGKFSLIQEIITL